MGTFTRKRLRVEMNIKPLYVVLAVAAVALLAAGITLAFTLRTPEAQPTSTIDMPYLTSQEAIAIAQQEAANLEYNVVAALARSSSRDWRATYIGGGKWTADFYYGANIYRWTVFEKNLTAVYIGAFARH
jgi:hypothetical protein